MKVVVGTGGVEDGVLHRAEELHAVTLPHPQHRLRQAVELILLHLLPLELLPAAAHGDLRALRQLQPDPLPLQLPEQQPGVGGKADGADGKGPLRPGQEAALHGLQVQPVAPLPPHQGVGPAEGRGEEGEGKAGLAEGGVVAPPGLVAQNEVVAGRRREEAVVACHPHRHGQPPAQGPGVQAHPAHHPAGAGGGGPDEELPLRQGAEGVALAVHRGQGRQDGGVPQVCQTPWVQAVLAEDAGVVRAALRLKGGVLPHGGGKQPFRPRRVVGVSPPKQFVTVCHHFLRSSPLFS